MKSQVSSYHDTLNWLGVATLGGLFWLVVISPTHGQRAGGGATGGIGGGTAGGGVNVGGGGAGQANAQIQQGAGQIDGSERFGRENRAPGTFVGADATDAQNFFAVPTANTQNQRARGNATTRNNFQQTSGNQSSRGANLRRRMNVRFDYARVAPPRVNTNLNRHFNRLTSVGVRGSLRFPGNVQITMQGRTAVLSGSTASQDDAAVAVALAKLEPGVSQVRNELTVESSLNSPSRGFDQESMVVPEDAPFEQNIAYPLELRRLP